MTTASLRLSGQVRAGGESRAATANSRAPVLSPQIGGYRLSALVHRGRDRQLFRAAPVHEPIGPGCYLLKTAAAGSRLGAAMLRREAEVLAEISGPHLPGLLASQMRHEPAHLVLAYLDGVALDVLESHRLAARDRRTLRPQWQALGMVRQIAAALAAAHEAGWLHGQVEPRHILLSPRGIATVLDWGGARRLETGECLVGEAVAATPFTAPEASTRQARLTAAADVYSLGVVLYLLVCGVLPFAAPDWRALANQHRTLAPPDPRSHRPGLSLEGARLLREMLAKEPLRRPTVSEVIANLAALEIEELSQA